MLMSAFAAVGLIAEKETSIAAGNDAGPLSTSSGNVVSIVPSVLYAVTCRFQAIAGDSFVDRSRRVQRYWRDVVSGPGANRKKAKVAALSRK